MFHFINKRLQVFISSTYKDLQNERQAAVKAILEADHIPAGMELFTSGDEGQMKVIKQWIEDSDVYLLILGGRYGSIDPQSGKSYTHLEYEYAVELGKPMFACVMTNEYLDSKIQGSNYKEIREQLNIDRLSEFNNLVMSKIVFQCHDVNEMKYQIMRKMKELDRDDSLTGWIRASESYNSALLSEEVARLSQENRELRDRIEKISSQENQSSDLMIHGVPFNELCNMLSDISLLEEDLFDTKNIPNGYPVDDDENGYLSNAVNGIREGQMKNTLDLLTSVSNIILRSSNSQGISLLRIVLIPKMEIVFNADILGYHNGSNMMFKSVRFTTIGELFIKYVKMPRNSSVSWRSETI
jgi:Domain of unknown function (DUF4062)